MINRRILFSACIFGVAVMFGAVGCATVGGDDSTTNENQNNINTNTNQNNNTNTNSNGSELCRDTCTQADHVCVGPDEEHQTCAEKCDNNECPAPNTCCYGGCVNTQADPNNCGSCWNACGDDASCINGMCVDACNNMCRADQDCCDGVCTDVTSDPNNCGTCGHVCNTQGQEPTASDCTNSYCTCGTGPECTGGEVCCGASCRDLNNDPSNCGSCGRKCAEGEACNNGTCECAPGVTCGANEACCNGTCVDTSSDDQNCGTCDNVCENGNTCNNGQCNCNGEICEGGSLPGQDPVCCSDGCVVYSFGMDDPMQLFNGVKNCGSCDNDCPMFTPCFAGECFSE